MARVTSKSVLKGLSGKLGHLIIRTNKHGVTTVSSFPRTSRSKSEAQHQIRQRFRDAVCYARFHMRDEEMKLLYSVGITDNKTSAYAVAMSDYLNKPVVNHIVVRNYRGRIGDRIIVTATDDFRVALVIVTITNKDGQLLERGPTVAGRQDQYVYTAQTSIRDLRGVIVSVTVWDVAGNCVTESVTLGRKT